MTLSTQPYKGTRDFYPDEMRIQRWMFDVMRSVVEGYGFQEYDGPMLEPFELYAAKTGEEIVNTQLYWLIDRGERKMAIRPEMTPTLARMVAAKIHELPRPIRWYSIPNLWRYERPQKGRLREHWQLNLDVLGGDPLLADLEILGVAADLVKAFGGEGKTQIRINHRQLVDFFFNEDLKLDPEKSVQITKALDARLKVGEDAFRKWIGDIGVTADQFKKLEDFFHLPLEKVLKKYPCPGSLHLQGIFSRLKVSDVVFDPMVLRGMDYYTGTVFEMYDSSPENRRAMFGGGRYDDLVGMFGKQKLSGVGLGMGDVTLRNFLEVHGLLPRLPEHLQVFVTLPKEDLLEKANSIAAQLREAGFRVATPLGVGGFGEQLKQASKLGAALVVLLGDEELSKGSVSVKAMASGKQETVALSKLEQFTRDCLNKGVK